MYSCVILNCSSSFLSLVIFIFSKLFVNISMFVNVSTKRFHFLSKTIVKSTITRYIGVNDKFM